MNNKTSKSISIKKRNAIYNIVSTINSIDLFQFGDCNTNSFANNIVTGIYHIRRLINQTEYDGFMIEKLYQYIDNTLKTNENELEKGWQYSFILIKEIIYSQINAYSKQGIKFDITKSGETRS